MRSLLRLFRNTFRRKKKPVLDEKDRQPITLVSGTAAELIQPSEESSLGTSSQENLRLSDEATTSQESESLKKEQVDDMEESKILMECLDLGRLAALRIADQPEAVSATVHDDNGKELAKETIIKYTGTQAYVVLSCLDAKLQGKAIKVADDENLHKLKLISIENERENRRLLPIAVQFHTVPDERPAEAHLTDRLTEDILGRFNLELKKNVTIDSFALNDTWRDEVGFIVSDRNRYELFSFDAEQLVKTLTSSQEGLKMETYTNADFDALSDFDHGVCGFSRDAALEFLTANASILLARGNGNNIDGMLAAKGDRVVALYAETMEIAHALLKSHIEKNKLIQVVFFSRADIWECTPSSSRTVYRRHTRAVPSSIKWNKVYALNMGVHIV